mmetsp:Transcript_31662/g.47692  ORF Transcript_31662/g.47692 Transcript_31662/m.47692 type:complete len:87 (-) Transcript_31662:76-336(-)
MSFFSEARASVLVRASDVSGNAKTYEYFGIEARDNPIREEIARPREGNRNILKKIPHLVNLKDGVVWSKSEITSFGLGRLDNRWVS